MNNRRTRALSLSVRGRKAPASKEALDNARREALVREVCEETLSRRFTDQQVKTIDKAIKDRAAGRAASRSVVIPAPD